ncbi:hypothetical protein BD626DRAFT_564234 [Schizophyllum amplum]|uniref:F-box domain-containing protein n=1 Tax=Schizophyllum amplum TaxID=97359 RepID=A0A550D0R4_9AGAR|nr:hypothetical protein BD626DRAFT_564234 [Auriculariopsis ampla]
MPPDPAPAFCDASNDVTMQLVAQHVDSTQLVEKLRTAYSPSRDEEENIQSSIARAETQRHEYTREVDRLRATIAMYESRISDIDAHISALQTRRALLAPVRRLPAELLGSVFAFACEDGNTITNRLWPALAISRVCSCWRDIALASTALWSFITMNYDVNPSHHGQYVRSIRAATVNASLLLCLRRSGDVPLRVVLIGDSSATTGHLQAALQMLCDAAYRWHSLTSTTHFSTVVARMLENGLPRLEHLTVRQSGKHKYRLGHSMPTSQLQSYSGPPWLYTPATLVRVELSLAEPEDVVELLLRCTNLKDLCLVPPRCQLPVETQVRDRVIAPSLRILRIESMQADFVWEVLRTIKAPALRELRVMQSNYREGPIVVAVEDFLGASLCHLARLTLRDVSLTANDLQRLMEMTPHLKRLVVSQVSCHPHSDTSSQKLISGRRNDRDGQRGVAPRESEHKPLLDDNLTHRLIPGPGGQEVILPCLERLDLDGVISGSLTSLADMVDGRRESATPLRTVRLVIREGSDLSDDKDAVERLRGGLGHGFYITRHCPAPS